MTFLIWGEYPMYINSHFLKEEMQIAKRHMKRCTTQVVIREI